MPICKHHRCVRKLKTGFNGPKKCEDCSPPLQHIIPGNNDDKDKDGDLTMEAPNISHTDKDEDKDEDGDLTGRKEGGWGETRGRRRRRRRRRVHVAEHTLATLLPCGVVHVMCTTCTYMCTCTHNV